MGRSIRNGVMAACVAGGLLAAGAPALADNDIGCGVGTMLMDGKSGLGYKLLGSSTNGITFQSISITFGLVNCDGHDTVTAQIDHFTSSNFDRLAADMSTGRGETLAAFATLLQVAPADREAFDAFTQANFTALFPADDTTAGEMLDHLDRLLRQDERLRAYARG